ncbi:MAG: serine/threonine-protein kinase [Gemmatimonadota bacterium]
MESRDSSASNDSAAPDALRDDPAFAERGLQITNVLGSGRHSIVFRARDARHGRDVAIKVLRPASLEDGTAERFTQEIRVAAGLRHPNILPLFDSGSLQDGRQFAVMPVAHGRPLRAMIDEGPLAIADAVRLACEVAEALTFLHTNGWVHRDVKPENILVESGHAVLTDFGVTSPMHAITARSTVEQVARLWGKDADLHVTIAGMVVGTLHYLSPEALLGDAPIDARVDVFALGLVLYEMLAGELPFRAATAPALIAERLAHPLPALRSRRADVPQALDTAIARATCVTAIDRYPGAAAFRAVLDDIPVRPRDARVELTIRERDRRTVVVAVLLPAGIGSAIGVLRARTTSSLDPQRIVVADLANETGDGALARLGPLAGDLITTALNQGSALQIVNATVALGSIQRPRLPASDSALKQSTRALVADARAGLLVTGAYYREGRALKMLAEVTDTRGGRVLGAVGPMTAEADAPEVAIRALADSIVAVVKRRHAPPG